MIHEWLQAAETPRPKAIIRWCLLDFSKVFDRIHHNIVLRKLQLLNMPPILFNWCAAFLRNRQQCVNQWIVNNNIRVNAKKTKELNINLAKSPPILQPLTINNVPLDCVQSTKLC